jgi:putative CocE/NonD family hydrolase
MRHVTDLPHRIRVVEHLWIPLADGCRLAAKLWLPADAETAPVPGIVEYIPYRKRDMTAVRDSATHPYLAGHGYACLRVDVRGTGDSDGLYSEQFAARYTDDVVQVIAWVAGQPWCRGEVAMLGLSWGGASALQAAARRPPALKTVVCVAGVDDRYALRYPGGCLLTAALVGSVAQITYATRPPDPAIVGPGWLATWQKRLEHAEPLAGIWLRHPTRDAYWRDGSVSDDYGRIVCPVLAAAGWADPGFASAMLRLLAGLPGARKGLIGPWSHRYPHFGLPGPAIGFLQETLRWLDHWLKGADTGVMNEPMLRVFMPETSTVRETPEDVPGRWVAEPVWPSPRIAIRELATHPGRLAEVGGPDVPLPLASPQNTGEAAGEWMPIFTTGPNPELAGDQRPDDARSLCFDSAPLPDRLEILGAPEVTLELSGDRPAGLVVARLCEVAPDGTSRRVSYGALDLTRGDESSAPAGIRPGRRARMRVSCYPVADGFAAGHRIRLAVSTAYWPTFWPAPAPVALCVHTGGSRLALPVRPRHLDDALPAPFLPPEGAPATPWTVMKPAAFVRRAERDPATGAAALSIVDDAGAFRIEAIGLDLEDVTERRFRIHPDDPTAAVLDVEMRWRFARADWSTAATTRSRVTCTAAEFRITTDLEAFEGDAPVFARQWTTTVPRP